MTPKLLPTTLILGCTALLAFAFILPSTTPQTAAVGTTATPNVSFTQDTVQTKEGTSVKLTVKLDQPVTKTTKVTIKLTRDPGTTNRDVSASTASVTFYKNSPITSKSITVRTTKTAAEGDKGFTASIAKVGSVSIPQARQDTVKVTILDQKTTNPNPVANNQNQNQNQNTNTTATSTPPTDCDKYAGVIPGETRKLTVETKSFSRMVLEPKYTFSAEAQRDLEAMQGDIGLQGFTTGLSGSWNRIRIPAGTVFAYKFKTTEYNYRVWQAMQISTNPETLGGVMGVSVSQCPGDFTSPAVLEQVVAVGSDREGRFPDGNLRDCVTYNWPINSGIEFGVDAYSCSLDTNKTYYLNITPGFMRDTGLNTPFPYMTTRGHDRAAEIGDEMVVDITFWGRVAGKEGVLGQYQFLDVIKNRPMFYAEYRRALAEYDAESKLEVARCRSAIAANSGPRTGNECSLSSLKSLYYWR